MLIRTALAPEKICSGCAACYAVCPQRAIVMKPDIEGFLRPVIDRERCMECGLCAKICPSLKSASSRKPMKVLAVRAREEGLRLVSSSGGVFSLLALNTLSVGGCVFGAGWDRGNWKVVHKKVEDVEGLEDLRGSKYVQSDLADIFHDVRDELKTGRQVLFSGTPCQIAGLRSFLAKEYVNLLTVEIVCHGVPSPMVWQKYLRQVAGREGVSPDQIVSISFRRKDCGWKKCSSAFTFANGSENLHSLYGDPYISGFLHELYNRPSCHDCQVRGLRSGSDLTIGDFWGVDKYMPDMDDDRGTSLLLVNTLRGQSAFDAVSSKCESREATYLQALAGNRTLEGNWEPHRKRGWFMSHVEKNDDVISLVQRALQLPWWRRARRMVGRTLYKMGVWR